MEKNCPLLVIGLRQSPWIELPQEGVVFEELLSQGKEILLRQGSKNLKDSLSYPALKGRDCDKRPIQYYPPLLMTQSRELSRGKNRKEFRGLALDKKKQILQVNFKNQKN